MRKLMDVCELIVDCPHTTAPDEGAGYPLIRTPNIGKGRLILDNVHRVCKEVYDARNARAIPQADDIILAREAPAGNVALIQKGQEVCLGQRTVLIRADKEKVNPAYLTYYLLAPKQQHDLKSSANGATVGHINMPRIRGLKVDLPVLSIQRKIAEILSAYDNLIDNYRRQIKLLEEAAQRLYKEWFVDLHFPGYEHTKIVDGVPEGWEKKNIGELLEKIKRTKQIPSSKIQKHGLYPVIDQGKQYIAGYTNDANAILYNENPIIVFGDHTRIIKLIPFPFAKGADGTQLLLSNNLIRMPQSLFYYSLKNVDLSNYSYARHFKYLKAMTIYLPSDSIAQKFNTNAFPVIKEIQKYREQIIFLTEARDRLLPKLMSGEIKV